jgi:hypothetical protein
MQDLMVSPGPFRKLVEEFGSKAAMTEQDREEQGAQGKSAAGDNNIAAAAMSTRREGAAYMLEEDREMGSVSRSTYGFWLSNMGSS